MDWLNTMAAADPASHVYNHPFHVTDSGLWLWSANQGNLVLSALILIGVGWWASKKISADGHVTKNRFAHMIEVICVYLREEVARPLLGDRTNRLMPFLWTIFFFILVNNLLGLLPLLDIVHLVSGDLRAEHRAPIGGTATQNIWVTGVLAVVAAIFFNLVAVRHLGIVGYLKHLTAGAPSRPRS